MKILVQFSGGKDSQACLIKAVNDYGKENVVACFSDTGWEHEDTYTHIHNVCNQFRRRTYYAQKQEIQRLCGYVY